MMTILSQFLHLPYWETDALQTKEIIEDKKLKELAIS